MLRWQIAIQDYRGNTTIIYKEVKSHTHADGLSRWPLDNAKRTQYYDPEVAAKISINFMKRIEIRPSYSLNGHQEVEPQILTRADQRRQKLPYWK
ncbi:hypothetical protein O181_117518 [Austropuccinia psidii MF-1]|uniref:Uncharacterized protein n=1 Tax=Austropuccinia psidii MF-1 TaxID=1389203 RepID=A0A9Q3PXJ7_9BASI|nr:hypothetical protein [Austropuccinia psidii MF-1]